MMTPRRVRRQDPELQFADEPVRHPVAAGSPASRGPRYAAIICGRGELVPEEPCVDRTLGRAPGEVQHARIKDSHLIIFGQAHRLCRPQREQRGAQPMLQRLTHRQVGRQGQHLRGFGQPQRAEGHRHPHHAGRRGPRGSMQSAGNAGSAHRPWSLHIKVSHRHAIQTSQHPHSAALLGA